MTTLHIYFSLRNQNAFQRVLDAPRSRKSSQAGLSSSGGKSRNRPSPLSSGLYAAVDVNARDRLGRTVLHLAASSTDTSAPEYVRMLLAHPDVNVNLADLENHWTALHRAAYHGNIPIVVQLLQRADVDVYYKDLEGYTAFDLYNSTVEGTSPALKGGKLSADLFTWGANRNATLGVGDGDDRAFPEQVALEPANPCGEDAHVEERFAPIHASQIVMSKLHTAVVTDESRGNLYMCGFGSGGRLGPGQHTQYSLVPLPQLYHTIVSVALGQDHTLTLTSTGEVLSWGLNRFSQLGYVVEMTPGMSSRVEEPIQATPRKISTQSLKGKFVRGVAACKTASACWTASEVYSWGTNNGQLGYDKAVSPVQILPRVVTKITQPVISVTITDSAMACLLETNDVVCIYNDNHFRVNFPAHAFPSEMKTYRPPQAIRNASIDKITSCDSMIAALSTNGELFTFSLPSLEPGTTATTTGKSRELVKPQRVWALRKKFSSVKDVALGAEGALIICTESGHVFVRARTGGKTFKFQRVPYMQRIVKVSANNTGAYAALRVDAVPTPLDISGNTLAQDIAAIQPYVTQSEEAGRRPSKITKDTTAIHVHTADATSMMAAQSTSDLRHADAKEEPGCPECPELQPTEALLETKQSLRRERAAEQEQDVEEDDHAIKKDRQELLRLCHLLDLHKKLRKEATSISRDALSSVFPAEHGADLLIHVQGGSEPLIPAHRVILAARSAVLADVLAGRRSLEGPGIKVVLAKDSRQARSTHRAPWKGPIKLSVSGCHALTVLILLGYLYSDNLLTLWDWRVAEVLESYFISLKIKPQRVKDELQWFAQTLELSSLSSASQGTFKREVQGNMVQQFSELLDRCTTMPAFALPSSLTGDVIFCLEDKDVPCHSAILRARSPLFQAFFGDDDWTKHRWDHDGIIRVQFKHLKWRPMQYVMRHIYGGETEMFDTLEFIHSVDELIEFLFDVISAANELLLDRLVQICSSVILRRVNISNVCAILSEATYYHATPLILSLQGYVAQNMETLLEGGMLDDISPDLVKQIAAYVRKAQTEKSHVTRSNALAEAAMTKNAEWLAMQDIPQLVIPSLSPIVPRDVSKLSPPIPSRTPKSLEGSPIMRPQLSSRPSPNNTYTVAEDEVFVMDGIDTVPPLNLGPERPVQAKGDVVDLTPKPVGWKVSSAPKVDMKTIMAEAETKRATVTRIPPSPAIQASSSASEGPIWRTPQRQPKVAATDLSRATGGSPWKTMPNASGSSLLSESLARTPPATPMAKPIRPGDDSARTKSSPRASGDTPRSQPQTPQRPGMGPVFTPTKQPVAKSASSSPSIRRTTSKAWTLPPVQPVVQASSSVMSFAEIQQLQLEQVALKKDKRSLKEIQEEERARQVEEDFLSWWAAEEERIRLEREASTPAVAQSQKRPRNKNKKAAANTPVQAEAKGSADASEEGRKEVTSSPRSKKRPPAPKRNRSGQDPKPAGGPP